MNKTVIFSLLLTLPLVSQAARLPDLDDEDVRDEVDIRAFEVGNDGDVANLYYIVDRTTNNCFAISRDNYPGGLTSISCDSLTAIPLIKHYIETGEFDRKKFESNN